MGKVIAIVNQKGGVGKTTTAINLSASLAVMEHATLVIDMDPQANCTSGLGFDPRTVAHSCYEVLISTVEFMHAVRPTDVPNLDLLPGNIHLVGAEIELLAEEFRERRLARALHKVKDRYDFIFIDCPPSLGLLTVNAMTAADSVLIPVQAEYFALEGLGQLLNTIKKLRRHLNPRLDIEGVLLTLFDARLRLSNQVAAEVKRYFDPYLFKTVAQRNVRIAEASSFGKPALMFDGTSTGAKNYLALAKEVLAKNAALIQQKSVRSKSPPHMVSTSGVVHAYSSSSTGDNARFQD